LEPSKVEARKILEGRIQNSHVLDVVHDRLLQAAEQMALTANAYLFQNGITAALKSYEQKAAQPIAEITDEAVRGELSTRAELYSIWGSSIAWREEICSELEQSRGIVA
jgi:hypothetical protein